jgi:hypothetical protein
MRARVVPLDAEARGVVVALRRELEPQVGPGGDLVYLRDWVAKLPGLTARLAGVLALADRAGEDADLATPIGAEPMGRALAIARYLLEHAKNAFLSMGSDPAVEKAKHVLDRLKRYRIDTVSKRGIQTAHPSLFRKSSDVDAVLAILVERGWLRTRPAAPRGPGRPPSPTYDVHPEVCSP